MFGFILFAAGPLLATWAMNTLFSVGIEYTISTWFAALIFMIIVGGPANTHRQKND